MSIHAGNPMKSPHIHTLLHGYLNYTKQQNLKPRAATPWTQEEVNELLAYIDKQCVTAEGLELVFHLRDAFIYSVMWETQSRAANAGAWEYDQLTTSSGLLELKSCSTSLISLHLMISRGHFL